MLVEPLITVVVGTVARSWARSMLYSMLRRKGFQIDLEPTALGTFRPDLVVTSRDGEKFIVESKRNVFADDVARMSKMIEDDPGSHGIIMSSSDTPKAVRELAEEKGVALINGLSALSGALSVEAGGSKATQGNL